MAAPAAQAALSLLSREASASFDQDDADLSGTLAAALSLASETERRGHAPEEEDGTPAAAAPPAAVVTWVESNLWCWGRSQDGQAGPTSVELDGTLLVPQPKPVAFPCAAPAASVRIVAVSCGSRHTLALDEQCVPYSWGWGLCGQLGQGDYPIMQPTPRVIAALAPGGGPESLTGGLGVKGVSAGGIHSAAVDMQGFVYTWGESSYGQLGLGDGVVAEGPSCPSPRRVMLVKESGAAEPLVAAQVSCGGMHTGAVTADGRLYTWGRGDNGQLGVGRQWIEQEGGANVVGANIGLSVPALVDPGCFESPVKQLSCGAFHTAIVTVRGRVYTWGREEHGMLGHDVSPDKFTDAQDRPKEVETRGQMGAAVSVSCGGWHTCVVTEAGKVFTCGRGEYGRLGLGDQKSQLSMVEVDGFQREHVTQASAGGTHTMILTRTGHLYTYGRGDYGRLGHGGQRKEEMATDSPRPKLVSSLMMSAARVRLVNSGGAHSAAIVEPLTEEEKGQEEEENLKALYGSSPSLRPGSSLGLAMTAAAGAPGAGGTDAAAAAHGRGKARSLDGGGGL